MQKYSKRLLFLCALFFYPIQLPGMQEELVFPLEIVKKIFVNCDIQSIARFGVVSKACNYYYQSIMFCRSNEVKCNSIACSFFAKNTGDVFDACTNCLVFYAKRYKEEIKEEDKQRFEHLLRHHEEKRMRTVVGKVRPLLRHHEEERMRTVVGKIRPSLRHHKAKRMRTVIWKKTKPSISDVLDTYAKNYLDCNQVKIFRSIVLRYIDYSHSGDPSSQVFATQMLFGRDVVNLINIYVFAEEKLLDRMVACDDTQVTQKLVDCFDYRNVLNGVMRIFVDQNKKTFVTLLIKKYGEEALSQAVSVARKQKKGTLFEEAFLFDLIEQYKDVTNKTKFDLFRLALDNNYQGVEILKLLFSDDMHAVDSDSNSLLHCAADYGNEDCIRFLLQKDVNINAVNNQGRTALEVFLRNGYSERSFVNVTEMFVHYGANINEIDIFGKSLMKNRYNPNIKIGDSQLQELRKAICFLIDSGSNINMVDDNGMTLLHSYAKHGCFDIIEKLIEKKSDIHVVDILGRTALHYACQWNHKNTKYRYNTIKMLLNAGININACDIYGNTGLLMLARSFFDEVNAKEVVDKVNIKEVVDFLLKQGANGSVLNKKKQNVFHYIAKQEYGLIVLIYSDVCKQMITAGADIQGVDVNDNTPIMIASKNNNPCMVEFLRALQEFNDMRLQMREGSEAVEPPICKDNNQWTNFFEVCRFLIHYPIFLGAVIGFSAGVSFGIGCGLFFMLKQIFLKFHG